LSKNSSAVLASEGRWPHVRRFGLCRMAFAGRGGCNRVQGATASLAFTATLAT
jgi:hypothetical protein